MTVNYRAIEQSIVAACAAATLTLNKNFLSASNLEMMTKESRHGLPDYATQADLESETAIKTTLSLSCPDIAFVGEEEGGDLKAHERFFLVDPLDGTSNFMSLRAQFAVCIAYIESGNVCAAAIANPADNNVLHASAGNGAFLTDLRDQKTLPVKGFYQTEDAREIQLDCEFPFTKPEEFSIVQKLLPSMSGLRKSGSTALDIFYQAVGRKSAVLSSSLAPYDIAPAILIAHESGGLITDLSGKPATIYSDTILSANPRIHKKILEALTL